MAGVDGDVFEMAADEEEVGSEELGKFVEVDSMRFRGGRCWGGDRSIGALVSEGRKSSNKEMEKLVVGGEVFDGGVKVVIEFVTEDVGGFAEGSSTGGEERDFWNWL